MERRFSLRLLAVATVATLAPPPLHAQSISVSLENGVHVRAPFTSVDVFSGGVRVRAPYTAVDIGGRAAYAGPLHVVRRPISSAEFFAPANLARMSDAVLWRTVRESSDRFMSRVGRFDTGDTWQRYLRLPDELQTDVFTGDAAQLEAVDTLLQRIDNIAADGQFRKISDLPQFTAMRYALAELIKRQASSGHVDQPELLPAPIFEGSSANRQQVP